ncbi:hypothetical protein [Tunturiibacter gelidoferens]|uniref:Uncharacterized protein n=1 Tax=Tunturiibacter gelidiferens TaxID=3069689 RepID=A0ACC5NTE5_9BACT|nr:hypothetical protein [Edaphobacter lichenicola]MBB5337840.1 hypothetical protein [Edaphobacter lichenicola]
MQFKIDREKSAVAASITPIDTETKMTQLGVAQSFRRLRPLGQVFLSCIVGCWLTGVCQAQILQQDAKPITVVYMSGEVEHYVVKWTGSRDIEHHEDGHPSEPLKGWITDTRQCHWSIATRIVRKLYLLNRNGQEYAQEELTTPLVENFANQGSDFILTQLRPENCGNANSRYESDVANSTKHVAELFPTNVAKDYQVVLNTLRTWPNVKSVQPK